MASVVEVATTEFGRRDTVAPPNGGPASEVSAAEATRYGVALESATQVTQRE